MKMSERLRLNFERKVKNIYSKKNQSSAILPNFFFSFSGLLANDRENDKSL